MKTKAFIICAFLLMIITSSIIGFAISSESVSVINDPDIRSNGNETAAKPGSFLDTNSAEMPEVVVYYFHTTYRCPSCKKIEAYSKEAVEAGFKEELDNGKLKFYSINTDESENKHYPKDYRLYTKSLIVCKMRDGEQVEWKNLIKVWQLIRNKEEFIKYVRQEITVYLKES